jgi:hypothetical protein
MDDKCESAADAAKGAVKDALGLPPGDKTPHGQGKRLKDPHVAHGTLTSEDRPKRTPANGDA